MTIAQAIDEIAESPEFFDVVEDFQRRREREERDRKRFEESLTEDVRAEFIAGKVVTQMSSRGEHIEVLGWIVDVVKAFVSLRGLGKVFAENALIRTKRSDYVPDMCFWPKSISKGFAKKQTIFPTPTWVVEVLSPDTAERDRGVKFREYATSGVAEYWIVDADAETIEQYRNVDGKFDRVKKHSAGTIRGIAIPTFSMPVRAAFDEAANARYLKKLWTATKPKK